jgi:hypothetical protein
MPISLCFSMPAPALQSGGLLHWLHYSLLWLGFFFFTLAVTLLVKISRQTKIDERSNRSLLALASRLNRNEKSAETTLPAKDESAESSLPVWGGTLARFARRSITIMDAAISRVLSGESRRRGTDIGIWTDRQEAQNMTEQIRRQHQSNRGDAFVHALTLVSILIWIPVAITVYRHSSSTVYFGLRVRNVVDDTSWKLISPATGPFTADFCSKVNQYEPRAGYVLCKLSYVDRGCFDISDQKDGFWWVKGTNGKTAVLSENDTFKPWPECVVDEKLAKVEGQEYARQTGNH